MISRLVSAVKRVIVSLILYPRTIVSRIDTRRMRQKCVVASTAVLYPQTRVHNNQPRDHIFIDEFSRIMGRLETFGHGGNIRIGKYCFVGENSYIWSANSITI